LALPPAQGGVQQGTSSSSAAAVAVPGAAVGTMCKVLTVLARLWGAGIMTLMLWLEWASYQ
jgi:hypothetical protein